MKLIPDTISELLRLSGGGNRFFLPPILDTPEKCVEAIRADSGFLQFAPENLKTAELCLAAVNEKNDGKYTAVGIKIKDDNRTHIWGLLDDSGYRLIRLVTLP